MLSADRDALICDMAETYHIYDVRALPVKMLATLACGLRDDSRIKLKITGATHYPPFVLLMRIHDVLTDVFYGADADVFRFRDKEAPKERESFGYDSGDELMAALARFNKN